MKVTGRVTDLWTIICAVAVLRRMLLVAAIIGTSVTVTATEHVDVWLVIAGTAGWSFVPLLQLGTGLMLLRGSRPPRRASLGRYFDTHWPWSVWILATHAALLVIPQLRGYTLGLLVTAVVPILLTIRLLIAVCQEQLGIPRRAAIRRVAEHQVFTYALVLIYLQLAIALWPRVVGVLW